MNTDEQAHILLTTIKLNHKHNLIIAYYLITLSLVTMQYVMTLRSFSNDNLTIQIVIKWASNNLIIIKVIKCLNTRL